MYKDFTMALHINNAATDKLARELAEETGESLTVAVNKALKERLERVGSRKREGREEFVAKLLAIAQQAKGLRKLKKSSREDFLSLRRPLACCAIASSLATNSSRPSRFRLPTRSRRSFSALLTATVRDSPVSSASSRASLSVAALLIWSAIVKSLYILC